MQPEVHSHHFLQYRFHQPAVKSVTGLQKSVHQQLPFPGVLCLRRILSITQRKDIHSEILSSCLITDILTRILIENDTENLSLGFMPAYLKTVLKEIDQHFQEPLSLESLAITAGVSKYHLAREFKKYLGMPPNEYLIVTRLNHSKTLLKYEDLTIEEIA